MDLKLNAYTNSISAYIFNNVRPFINLFRRHRALFGESNRPHTARQFKITVVSWWNRYRKLRSSASIIIGSKQTFAIRSKKGRTFTRRKILATEGNCKCNHRRQASSIKSNSFAGELKRKTQCRESHTHKRIEPNWSEQYKNRNQHFPFYFFSVLHFERTKQRNYRCN